MTELTIHNAVIGFLVISVIQRILHSTVHYGSIRPA